MKELSDLSETVFLYTPYFYNPSTADAYIDCWCYITSPPSYQVELSIIDLDTVNSNERIYIYDDPSSTSYRVLYMYGQLDSKVTTMSTRGGLTLRYYDTSTSYDGPGFVAEARIHGKTMLNEFISTTSDCFVDYFIQGLYVYHLESLKKNLRKISCMKIKELWALSSGIYIEGQGNSYCSWFYVCVNRPLKQSERLSGRSVVTD